MDLSQVSPAKREVLARIEAYKKEGKFHREQEGSFSLYLISYCTSSSLYKV